MLVGHDLDKEFERFDEWTGAAGPWRPHPLSHPETPLPRATRAAVLLAILLAHVGAFRLLDIGSRLAPHETDDTVTTLVFIAPAPAPAAPTPEATAPRVAPPLRAERPPRARDIAHEPATPPREPATPPQEPSTAPHESEPLKAPVDDWATETPPDPGAMVAVEPPSRGEPLQLYDTDGSVALPDDVVARLAAVDADDRPFEFRMPGVVESGRFLDRPPVLAYESTRFDQYWMPDQGALTRILEKAVKATTGTVEIPIPGTRGGKLVCSVSILALGGGCGVRNNSNGYVVQLDDPDTLSAEEDAQCRAWWDQIVAAGSQDAWRHTRALYDASCRKPLAKEGPVPARG